MLRFLTALIGLFVLASLLTACGPIYKKEYAYVPPRSNMGKMCISQCVQAKSSCEQICQLRNQNCISQAKQEALYQYTLYQTERQNQGKKIKKTINDFDRSYTCQTSCNCMPAFRTCYSACGGQVLERQVCVDFCDKQ